MSETLRFLLVLEALGLAGAPLAARALPRLPGAGAGLGRILALLLLGWLVWLLGSLGIGTGTPVLLGAVVVVAAAAAWAHARRSRDAAPDPFRRPTLLTAEALFVLAFLAAAALVAFDPTVWGTEKPMDMAIINATNLAGSYPPHDPWLSGFDLNYYYLGQLLVGLLLRLTDVEPSRGYNLALAAVFALVVSTTFAVTTALAETGRRQGLPIRRPAVAGLGAVALLALAGNLRGGWDALTGDGPLRAFDWFSPSRVVAGTINEFPAFSFAVGDLHAHLIAVPLTLLGLAFAVQVVTATPPAAARGGAWTTFCAALALGILYAVNSWSWPVMTGLFAAAVGLTAATRAATGTRVRLLAWGAGTVVLGIVLVLPFIVGFDPNAGGFGIVPTSAREGLGAFLRHHAVMEGALLWLVLVPLGAVAARHPRPAGVAVAAAVILALVLGGPRLGGAVLLAAAALGALATALGRGQSPAERLLWLLVAAGLALLAGPEVVYVRDEFDGSEFVRMNTVFKLGYQAWLLLAVAGGVLLAGGRRWLGAGAPRRAWQGVAVVLVAVGLAYPVGAALARTNGFAGPATLEGRAVPYVSPGDRRAIDWLRAGAAPDAVVAEAVGDDYNVTGAGRVSVFTGRPTVLGWQGHEQQWSHPVGTRRADVQALYTTPDPARVRALVARYGIDYAVVGPLERATYGRVGALVQVGRPAFAAAGTTVYRLR